MAQEVVADGLPLTTRHRMGFLSAQDVRHMNCNADEECILQDRALLLRSVVHMASHSLAKHLWRASSPPRRAKEERAPCLHCLQK
jgi:hypothetical protein